MSTTSPLFNSSLNPSLGVGYTNVVVPATANSIAPSIFQRVVGPVERNPVKTALLTVVTAGLSPAIFAIGGLVATIAAGIFALIAMTLTLVEILALREIYLKNQARTPSMSWN